jgi:hypothetical protein
VAFAMTVVVAFFIAFSDWRVRASVFYEGFNYYLYILLSTMLLVPLLTWLGLFESGGLQQTAAFLTGILVGYLIFRLTKAMQMRRPWSTPGIMKNFIRETGYFFTLSLVALALLPLIMKRLPMTTEAYTANRMEKIFIIQLSILCFLGMLIVLYVLRLIVTLVVRKLLGGGGGGVKPWIWDFLEIS